jgi:predicted dehydrogenase
MLCPPPHGMRGCRFMRKLLRDGYIGEPWHFRLTAMNGVFSDPLAPPHWRQRTELNGINVLSVGIYAEVLERWLGSPRRLHAQMKVSVPKRDGYVVQRAGRFAGMERVGPVRARRDAGDLRP